MAARAREITEAVTQHGHKRVALVTLTLRHRRGMRLVALRKLLAASYSAMKAGRAGGDLKTSLEYVGDIRSAETTHGENGWHPHLHALWFTRGPVDLSKMRGALDDAWGRAVYVTWRRLSTAATSFAASTDPNPALRERARQLLGARYFPKGTTTSQGAESFLRDWDTLGDVVQLLPDTTHGVDVTATSERGARYIAKLGLEVGAIVNKSGSQTGQRTSWQIANDAADGDLQSRALWQEHASAMMGARQLTWSRDLRAAVALPPREYTDAELATEPLLDEDERLFATIDAETWDGATRHLKQYYLELIRKCWANGTLDKVAGVQLSPTPWRERYGPAPYVPLAWWERNGYPVDISLPPETEQKAFCAMSATERQEWREEVAHRLADRGITPKSRGHFPVPAVP